MARLLLSALFATLAVNAERIKESDDPEDDSSTFAEIGVHSFVECNEGNSYIQDHDDDEVKELKKKFMETLPNQQDEQEGKEVSVDVGGRNYKGKMMKNCQGRWYMKGSGEFANKWFSIMALTGDPANDCQQHVNTASPFYITTNANDGLNADGGPKISGTWKQVQNFTCDDTHQVLAKFMSTLNYLLVRRDDGDLRIWNFACTDFERWDDGTGVTINDPQKSAIGRYGVKDCTDLNLPHNHIKCTDSPYLKYTDSAEVKELKREWISFQNKDEGAEETKTINGKRYKGKMMKNCQGRWFLKDTSTEFADRWYSLMELTGNAQEDCQLNVNTKSPFYITGASDGVTANGGGKITGTWTKASEAIQCEGQTKVLAKFMNDQNYLLVRRDDGDLRIWNFACTDFEQWSDGTSETINDPKKSAVGRYGVNSCQNQELPSKP